MILLWLSQRFRCICCYQLDLYIEVCLPLSRSLSLSLPVCASCGSQPSINDKCKWLSKPINYRNSRGHLYGCDCWRQTNSWLPPPQIKWGGDGVKAVQKEPSVACRCPSPVPVPGRRMSMMMTTGCQKHSETLKKHSGISFSIPSTRQWGMLSAQLHNRQAVAYTLQYHLYLHYTSRNFYVQLRN